MLNRTIGRPGMSTRLRGTGVVPGSSAVRVREQNRGVLVTAGVVAVIAAVVYGMLLLLAGASSARAACDVIAGSPNQCATAQVAKVRICRVCGFESRGYAALGWFARGGFYVFRACDSGQADGQRVVAFASFNAGGPGALQNFVQAKNGSGTCGTPRRIQPRSENRNRTVYIRACLHDGPVRSLPDGVYGCGPTQAFAPR
jgi:hypothetical protein